MKLVPLEHLETAMSWRSSLFSPEDDFISHRTFLHKVNEIKQIINLIKKQHGMEGIYIRILCKVTQGSKKKTIHIVPQTRIDNQCIRIKMTFYIDSLTGLITGFDQCNFEMKQFKG